MDLLSRRIINKFLVQFLQEKLLLFRCVTHATKVPLELVSITPVDPDVAYAAADLTHRFYFENFEPPVLLSQLTQLQLCLALQGPSTRLCHFLIINFN